MDFVSIITECAFSHKDVMLSILRRIGATGTRTAHTVYLLFTIIPILGITQSVAILHELRLAQGGLVTQWTIEAAQP